MTPAAPGVSFAHPMGLNTNANQNASGGTTAPLQSWANNDYFNSSKDVGALLLSSTRTSYGNNLLPDGSNPSYDGFAVIDVTSIVQLWANGTPELRVLHAEFRQLRRALQRDDGRGRVPAGPGDRLRAERPAQRRDQPGCRHAPTGSRSTCPGLPRATRPRARSPATTSACRPARSPMTRPSRPRHR